MDEGRVLYATHGGVHVLRLVGAIAYRLCPSIEQFVDGLIGEADRPSWVIDLTETVSIDSTGLGLLGHVANGVRRRGGPRVSIVSSRPDINELLTSMGFREVFDIVERSDAIQGEGQVLAVEEADRRTLGRTLLRAHRTLMELGEHNRELFRDVVRELEDDSGAD